ncbi:transcriptional regulator [Actinophytocola xinjiangensis]|uniref:transcriptional regulator n=1 Tax=Actinophytocola xinjiangensis TaxID=485602 RepID=UPI000A4988C2|nr:transcriptional regulator [Actinophytocola xinjiangensis]
MAPSSHGQGGRESTLQVDVDAVPMLRSAFVDALAKVDRQLELAEQELRVTPWATDPVSQDAVTAFNDRSVDGGRCAIEALRAYRAQLDAAVVNLDKTVEQYRETDGDGQVDVNRTGGEQ